MVSGGVNATRWCGKVGMGKSSSGVVAKRVSDTVALFPSEPSSLASLRLVVISVWACAQAQARTPAAEALPLRQFDY